MILIGEGYTDPIHLKMACHNIYPQVLNFIKFSSLQQTKRFSKIMGYSGGTGILNKFLKNYKVIYKAQHISLMPCVIIVDGDTAGAGVIKSAKSEFKKYSEIKSPSLNSSPKLDFLHLFKNLYIIQLPNSKVIEDFYDPIITSSLIGSRTYNPSNNSFDLTKYYGKLELIEKIVNPNQKQINFSNFDLIFNTIFHLQLYHYIYSNLKK